MRDRRRAGWSAMVAAVVALIATDLAALLIAAVLAGVDGTLMGSLGDVDRIALPDREGDLVASYFVIVCLGTAIPAIGVGAMANTYGLPVAIRIFACMVHAIRLT